MHEEMDRVLVSLDFSEVTMEVLERARLLAHSLPAKLWLIHVMDLVPDLGENEPGPGEVKGWSASGLSEGHQRTVQVAEKLRRSGLEVVALCPRGPTVKTILTEAEKLAINLIVLGSHGRGLLHRSVLGSVSEGVLHHATCPVMIIPAER